jgi:hypothetical protein
MLIAGVVAAVVGLGLSVTGGPGAGRMAKRDQERLSDLLNLVQFIHCRADAASGILPDRLDPDPACNVDIRLSDPFTGFAYSYARTGDTGFRICAGFEQPQALTEIHLDDASFERSTGCVVGTHTRR